MIIDIDNIEKLISIMNNGDISLIEITNGDNTIKIKKSNIYSRKESVNSIAQTDFQEKNSMSEKTSELYDFNTANKVFSPLVGVFYSSPSPDADPFVKIGSKVKKGDILCIIETMKVLNEITSDYDGEIVDINIKNGDIAEFNQLLFSIMPLETR